MTDLAGYRFVSRGEAQGKKRAKKSDLPSGEWAPRWRLNRITNESNGYDVTWWRSASSEVHELREKFLADESQTIVPLARPKLAPPIV